MNRLQTKRPGSISNEPGRPDHRVLYRSISRARSVFLCCPSSRSLLPGRPCRGVRTDRCSTTSVTCSTVMAKVAIAISNCDRSTMTAARSVGLELRKLLTASCRRLGSGRTCLQGFQRRCHSLCDLHRRLSIQMAVGTVTVAPASIGMITIGSVNGGFTVGDMTICRGGRSCRHCLARSNFGRRMTFVNILTSR